MHLNLLKSDQQFYCLFHYYFLGLHFFCYVYLAAVFKHIEKEKYNVCRITQFVSTSMIIYFLSWAT